MVIIELHTSARQYAEDVLPDDSTGIKVVRLGKKVVKMRGGYESLFYHHVESLIGVRTCRGTNFIAINQLSGY